jgi:hypothetical protein
MAAVQRCSRRFARTVLRPRALPVELRSFLGSLCEPEQPPGILDRADCQPFSRPFELARPANVWRQNTRLTTPSPLDRTKASTGRPPRAFRRSEHRRTPLLHRAREQKPGSPSACSATDQLASSKWRGWVAVNSASSWSPVRTGALGMATPRGKVVPNPCIETTALPAAEAGGAQPVGRVA